MEMESARVKFFNKNPGKMYGILVDDNGKGLFFHYSGGCTVALDGNDIVFEETPSRYPKTGDRLMFKLGWNAKGAKAKMWCFADEYEEVAEKVRRYLTLDEAKGLLAKYKARVLEYVKEVTSWNTTTVTTSTTITWSDSEGFQMASAGFAVMEERSGSGPNRKVSETGFVDVFSPDHTWFRNTRFEGDEANILRPLGKGREVQRGVYASVMWNGGVDVFVIDHKNVREITVEEIDSVARYIPWLGQYEWLKCSFAARYGNEGQVVKILAHLDGGE